MHNRLLSLLVVALSIFVGLPASAKAPDWQLLVSEPEYRADWFEPVLAELPGLNTSQSICDENGAVLMVKWYWLSPTLTPTQIGQLKSYQDLVDYSSFALVYNSKSATSSAYRRDSRVTPPAYFSKLPPGLGGPAPFSLTDQECRARSPVAIPVAYWDEPAEFINEHISEDDGRLYWKPNDVLKLLTVKAGKSPQVRYTINLLSDRYAADNVAESLRLVRKTILPVDLSATQPYSETKWTRNLGSDIEVRTIAEYVLKGDSKLTLTSLLRTRKSTDGSQYNVEEATVEVKLEPSSPTPSTFQVPKSK